MGVGNLVVVNEEIDIMKSELCMVYINELYYLCEAIKRECDGIFSEAKVPADGYMIQVSPVLHSRINSVLIYATNIKNLIYTPKDKKKKESVKKYNMRKARAELFEGILSGLSIKEIKNNKVRNTLEHFDEYLDECNLELAKTYTDLKKNHGAAAYNMTFSNKKVIQPDVYPIRLYISDEKKFYNFDWSIDIGMIYDEALSVLKRLKDLELLKEGKSGGLLVTF